MRSEAIGAGLGAAVAAVCLVSPACAQSHGQASASRHALSGVTVSDAWRVEAAPPRTVADLLTRIDRREAFADTSGFEADIAPLAAADARAIWADDSREARFEGGDFTDRVRLRTAGRLRRADGAPVPPGPRDEVALERDAYDVTYTRGWTGSLGQTENGLDVTLTPHVGVGVGSRWGLTEAGATLRIGPDLDRLVPNGRDRFGERARWYVYAAGSGRAVGYNFARTRDGAYARSGMSQDKGSFLGDASIGVAMRRGAVQSSLGLVYREIEAEGLRVGSGVDTDVSEGLVAFQLSIRPE